MSDPRTIHNKPASHGSISRSPFSSSYLSASPIAQESIARDLAECGEDEYEEPESPPSSSEDDDNSEASTIRPGDLQHSMANSYRRPSFVAFGERRATVTPHLAEPQYLTKKEKKQTRNEERSLLRDNYLAPPKHAKSSTNALSRIYKKLFSPRRPRTDEEAIADGPAFSTEPSETSALLGGGVVETARAHTERLNQQWEAAVASGKIKTTWQREAKTLLKYASPLVVTFVLQYSLTVASIFTVGHLGKIELGAVSLASMTANISGYAIYQGLATSLDTLCAQAYGSGKKHLVGLQLQRMVYFLWALTVPIGIIWLFAEQILERIVPEKESAQFAGLYLRVLLLGAPGYACFESGKRFVQAQGLFTATTYVLLICAPLNAFMNWLFVWHFQWGFIGAPIAVAITDNLLPVFLFLYVRYVDGRQCWNGFSWKAFHNWGKPIIPISLCRY
jgi:MATE family multidrug resistance protein